jgi:hypothetical protein
MAPPAEPPLHNVAALKDFGAKAEVEPKEIPHENSLLIDSANSHLIGRS